MEVITTHVNADFDAFASMVAAKKLYPAAVVAFPGSQEKSLRDFFMESTLYILSIERAKDINLDEVTRLILVDTRQKSRIGRFATIADPAKVDIHLYDHHPDSEDDVKGTFELVEEVGATVSILIRKLRERGLEVNGEEATILALGIYEDTGSFTFQSTTSEDLEAAGWLLQRGANLNVIADMMTSEMTRDQIEVLHQLIEGTEIVNVGGIDVVIATAAAEGYVGDLAILVHKYKDMDNLDVLFALVRMDDRVHIIARSRIEEVNVGEILAEFGGGGHPQAASATARDLTLYAARDELVRLLKERVRPKRKAGEIMSRPVISISPDQTISEAAESLSRYQVSSLPVASNGAVVGILHRNAVEKARHHGLEREPVHAYMNPGVIFVTPDEPIERVVRISVESRQRLVPVIEAGRLVGVISRSDLLEHLKLPRTYDSAGPDEFPGGRMRSKSVRKLIDELLPRRVVSILRRAGEVAELRGEDLYLVGGTVRDLLLRNPNLDIDVVIEGKGIDFAKELASEFPGCRVRGHEKFGTAVILFPDGFKIDVATARYEYYASPGALPTVETSSIKRDLYRRDFTMNTLAVCLNPQRLGRLMDFFGGARDIKERVIRVLHNLAFVEDPTRILRAIRFSSRFGFAIGKHTHTLMKAALKMKIFDKVEGKRVLNELIHILDEKNPIPALTLMAEYGIPEALHPALDMSVKTRELVEALMGVLSWWKYLFLKDKVETWLTHFLALADTASAEDFVDMMRRFSFPESKARSIALERAEMRLKLAVFSRGRLTRPSRIASALRRFSTEALLVMMAKSPREETRMAISEFITTMRYVKPILTGGDLLAMGYRPGPIVGAILVALRDARLDGRVRTREDEVEMVNTAFPEKNPEPALLPR
ncbi:MAG: CBS domain-containing protein [Desulfomonile tiedjei]|nr:CBS domain-containing protein [Desulfomonile tiedjei]